MERGQGEGRTRPRKATFDGEVNGGGFAWCAVFGKRNSQTPEQLSCISLQLSHANILSFFSKEISSWVNRKTCLWDIIAVLSTMTILTMTTVLYCIVLSKSCYEGATHIIDQSRTGLLYDKHPCSQFELYHVLLSCYCTV